MSEGLGRTGRDRSGEHHTRPCIREWQQRLAQKTSRQGLRRASRHTVRAERQLAQARAVSGSGSTAKSKTNPTISRQEGRRQSRSRTTQKWRARRFAEVELCARADRGSEFPAIHERELSHELAS